jgi:hypothetical protein
VSNPFYVLFNVALVVLAIRSALLLRRRSPWSTLGWMLAVGYGLARAVEFSTPDLHRAAGQVAYGFLIAVACAFIVAGVRDEPQAEPLLWPVRIGRTRAERRRPPAP